MAISTQFSGSLRLECEMRVALSGDMEGSQIASDKANVTFAASGGTDPDGDGFLKGTVTVAAAGDLLLAHATDPLQGMGDAQYSQGLSPAGKKIKLLRIRNTDAVNSITVARKALNGLTLINAASAGVVLAPGDELILYKKEGGDALATGVNDGLTLTPSAGSPTAMILVVYGP